MEEHRLSGTTCETGSATTTHVVKDGNDFPVEFADTIYNVDLATRNDVDRFAEAIGDNAPPRPQEFTTEARRHGDFLAFSPCLRVSVVSSLWVDGGPLFGDGLKRSLQQLGTPE